MKGTTSTSKKVDLNILQEWVIFLKGKKTYLVGALVALVVFLKVTDVIDESAYQALLGLLGGTGLITLKAGQSQLSSDIENK